jgi:hypothetical protein
MSRMEHYRAGTRTLLAAPAIRARSSKHGCATVKVWLKEGSNCVSNIKSRGWECLLQLVLVPCFGDDNTRVCKIVRLGMKRQALRITKNVGRLRMTGCHRKGRDAIELVMCWQE